MPVWREPVAQLAAAAGPVDYLMAPNYRLASELYFYWPDTRSVYLLGAPGRRFTQYDIWPSLDKETGATGLYVTTNSAMPAYLYSSFE